MFKFDHGKLLRIAPPPAFLAEQQAPPSLGTSLASHAQLQRLYVRTPDVEHTALVLRASIRFHAAAERAARCQPHGGRRPPSTYATISPEEKVLYNASSRYVAADRLALNALFRPYNELLTELVGHADFRWDY